MITTEKEEVSRVINTLVPGSIFQASGSFYCIIDRRYNVLIIDDVERIALNLSNGVVTRFDYMMTVTWYPNARLNLGL